jgi:hypothetical protein
MKLNFNKNNPIAMKTLQYFSLFFLLGFITSCSNDDTEKGYFPTNIELIDYTNSLNKIIISVNYNSNNTISEIILDGNSEIRTKQYSYTNGKITSVTNIGFLSGPDVRTFVYNPSGILSSIIDETDGSTETYLINYDAPSNTYTLIEGTESTSIQLDESGNPIRNSKSFLPSDLILTLDPIDKGVFEHLTPQIALQFDLALFNTGYLFYFFNQKQINHFEFGEEDFDLVNNRDTNGNISSVVYNFVGGGSQINITYQKRNL